MTQEITVIKPPKKYIKEQLKLIAKSKLLELKIENEIDYDCCDKPKLTGIKTISFRIDTMRKR